MVSANKALLADDLGELSRAADAKGVDLYYEAAVAGAIPIVRPLRESLVGDDITAVMGIVNGTTNYILDKMVTDGSSFGAALAEAMTAASSPSTSRPCSTRYSSESLERRDGLGWVLTRLLL